MSAHCRRWVAIVLNRPGFQYVMFQLSSLIALLHDGSHVDVSMPVLTANDTGSTAAAASAPGDTADSAAAAGSSPQRLRPELLRIRHERLARSTTPTPTR